MKMIFVRWINLKAIGVDLEMIHALIFIKSNINNSFDSNLGVSKKPAARFRPGPAQARRARARLWAGRAAGLNLGPAGRPVAPPLGPPLIFFLKIIYYIFI